MTSVLVSEDRPGVRESIMRRMSNVPGVARIEGVPHGFLLQAYSRQPVNMVLVGTQRSAPTGLEAVKLLLSVHRAANVLMFGSPRNASIIATAIASGARGYLHWDVDRAHLSVARPAVLSPRPTGTARLGAELSERELQVLLAMSEGKSNSLIGQELFLSEDTIKTHARRLYRKLGVSDRAEAVACGFRLGLVS